MSPTDEPTNFLYPFIDAEEHDPPSLLADLAASAQAKAAESAALRAPRWRPTPACWPRPPPRWRAGSPPADGCSPSATAAAPPTPPRWRAVRRPPLGKPLPAWSLTADQAILTALGNDVGFELVFARQLIARAEARRHRDRDVDQRQLAQPADRAGRGAQPRPVHHRVRRLRRRRVREQPERGRLLRRSFAERAPDPGSQALLGYQLWLAVHERLGGDQGLGAA